MAARRGKLEAMIWARLHGCPWSKWVPINAAVGGHVDIIQWARAHGASWRWFRSVNSYAAQHGKLEAVKQLRSLGFPVNSKVCACAAFGGHLHILQWLRSGHDPCPWDEETCKCAAHQGHHHVVKWAIDNGCPHDPNIVYFVD